MKVFSILLFSLFASLSFASQREVSHLIAIEEVIEEESIRISEYETQNDRDSTSARLYTERGISYFFNEEYDKAIADFNCTIEIQNEFDCKEALATALLGRMFSYAYLGDEEQVRRDLKEVRKILQCDQKYHIQNTRSTSPKRAANDRMDRVVGSSRWPDDKPMDV